MIHPKFSIAFLLGLPEISGGTYVIFEHATNLNSLGHDVLIITKDKIAPQRYQWHPAATKLKWLTLAEAKSHNFDIIIATWWESPFLLYMLKGTHYVYFIQSIESRFFPEDDVTHNHNRNFSILKQYCKSTYSCNIPVITEAQWIQNYLHEHYNRSSSLVRNGIRKDIYREEGETIAPRNPNRLRVLIEGPIDVIYKNVPKSIELCLRADVDEIWLLTSSDISKYHGVNRVFSKVPIHKTPAIFRSCDVLVKLSYIEGMFGPPLEMFHCGGTAIVYDVTGYDEYIVDGQNSFVVARDNEEEVINLLRKLKCDPNELQRLKRGAKQTAEKWIDWQGATLQFERALKEICQQQPTNQKYLQSWSNRMEADNLDRITKREVIRFQNRERGEISPPDVDNFIQIYCWAEKDGLENGIFKWVHYHSGEIIEETIEVEITGFPFWIRIDPSIRIGTIEIFDISVTSIRTGSIVYNCRQPEQFDELFVGGTLKNTGTPDRTLFLSYGEDPQLILPPITSGKKGDFLSITIQLHEMGMSDLIRLRASSVNSNNSGDRPKHRLKRLLSRIRR